MIVEKMQNKLYEHIDSVQSQSHISEIQFKDQGYTVRNRDNGGDTQTGFGIQGKSQSQDEKACSVKKRSVTDSFFHDLPPWFSFPRATSQADMPACPFGDCHEGQIPRSSAALQV